MKNYLLALWASFVLVACGSDKNESASNSSPHKNKPIATTNKSATSKKKSAELKAVYLILDTNRYSEDEVEEIVSSEMPNVIEAVDEYKSKKDSLSLTSIKFGGVWKNGEWKPKAGSRSKTTFTKPSQLGKPRLKTIPEIEVKKKPQEPIIEEDDGLSVSVVTDKENLPSGTEQVPFNNPWGMVVEILE